MIPHGAIIPSLCDYDDIPTSFVRETSFDSRYIKATISNFGNTGGNNNHTHTSSHTHTYSDGHTHTTNDLPALPNNCDFLSKHQDDPPAEWVSTGHTHSCGNSGVMADGNCSTAASTISTANNEYPRVKYIFIKSVGYNFVPENSILMRADDDEKPNAELYTNADGKYLQGADTNQTGGDSVSVSTHNHTQSHAHTLTHTHTSVKSGWVKSGIIGGLNYERPSSNHRHNLYYDTNTQTVSNNTNLSSKTNELAYQELRFWKTTSQTDVEIGDIVMFLGKNLPTGWEDTGYNDVYIKSKNSGSLTSGGSNTHSHDNISHNHSASSHSHGYTTSYGVNGGNGKEVAGTTGGCGKNNTHSHSGTTGNASAPTTSTTNMSIDSTNHEPKYINVRFIKATAAALGGGGILMLV